MNAVLNNKNKISKIVFTVAADKPNMDQLISLQLKPQYKELTQHMKQ